MFSSAMFSPCYKYRYVLTRVWDDTKPIIQFIGLNPSTADGTHNDPTIKRTIKFTTDWGYGGFYMTNLFAFRTPYPEKLLSVKTPVGPENDAFIMEYYERAFLTVLMWGNNGNYKNRDQKVLQQLKNTWCIKINKSGQPAHILYQPASAQIFPFK